MIKSNVNKLDLYMEIADELGTDVNTVKKVCEHQSRSLSEHIKNEKEEDFKLPLIGKVILKSKIPVNNAKGLLDDFEL